MPEGINKLIAPIISLSPTKRLIVCGIVILSALSFGLLIMTANRVDFKPLFSNLGNDDAGEIMKKLKEQKVPCRISDDGKAILVPAGKVYELRMSLASEGLPQGSGIGFEIFDRKNFGMTEFVQKLNYQRALQGELSRTISQIAGVDSARVHLALPEKSLFKENEKPPTASVVLKMKSARLLSENEVQGIIHLVASSIEGMAPDNISVIDSRGRMLNKPAASDQAGRLVSTMIETQHNFEKDIEDRLQSLLDRIVGEGKSAARVNVSLDYKNLEKYEERYDPQPVVRSEQRSEQKENVTTPAGIPGVQSNLGKTTVPAAAPGGGSKNDETKNYEISRSESRIVEPAGALNRISVAVLVDGKYEKLTTKKKGAPQQKYVPRTPDEMQKIEALVKSAVGFNPTRGDQVTVANIPFQEVATEGGEVGSSSWWEAPILSTILKNLLIVLGFLALIFLVLKPMLNMLGTYKPTGVTSFEAIEHSAGELGDTTQRAQLAMSKVNQLELVETVKKDPYQTAQILQSWLKQTD